MQHLCAASAGQRIDLKDWANYEDLSVFVGLHWSGRSDRGEIFGSRMGSLSLSEDCPGLGIEEIDATDSLHPWRHRRPRTFREPGLTHKEDLKSGSAAAVRGGITDSQTPTIRYESTGIDEKGPSRPVGRTVFILGQH